MTREELKEEASSTIKEMVSGHKKAPARGSYNRFLGKYTTAKKDVINNCIAHLKLLNQVSQMFHQEDVVTFEDEEVDLPKVSIKK